MMTALGMWIDQKNLNMPREDRSGKRWHFRAWYDVWTDDRVRSAAHHVTNLNLRKLIQKLIIDSSLRAKYRRELLFPLERHYSSYGCFPEEKIGEMKLGISEFLIANPNHVASPL
jgi:hypothetical protein